MRIKGAIQFPLDRGWGERPREPLTLQPASRYHGSRGRSPHQHEAFTLMEIMLALAVSAIVLAGIGGVFYSAVRLRERTMAMIDESVPLQQAFNFIRHDLQGALPPGGGNLPLSGDFKLSALGSGLGQNFHIEFFTTSGAVNDNTTWSDIQSISYELRDSTDRTKNNTGKDLVRTSNRNVLATAMQDPNEQPLLSNVQSLEFSCFDGMNWRDSWDTSLGDTNLPYAVRVRIQLAGDGNSRAQEPFEIVVPVVSQSRTNVPASTTTDSSGQSIAPASSSSGSTFGSGGSTFGSGANRNQ